MYAKTEVFENLLMNNLKSTQKGKDIMGYRGKIIALIPGIVLLGLIFACHVCAEEWDSIPEKYSIKALQQLHNESKIDTIYERCTQGVKEKEIPDKYKSILYTARARTYMQGEGASKKENALKAGLDCIRANHLDSKNFICLNDLYSYFSLLAMKSMEANKKENNQISQEVLKQLETKIIKERSDFLAELKQKAQSEKIDGVDAFFKNMPES